MKQLVRELLSQHQLSEIFNDSDYKYYLRKLKTNGHGQNEYLMALNIFDMFVLNARV